MALSRTNRTNINTMCLYYVLYICMYVRSSGIAPVHPGHRRGVSAAASGTLRISHKFVAAAAAATSAVSTPTGAAAAAAANAAHSFSCESPYNR
jgi:hypothetical protein